MVQEPSDPHPYGSDSQTLSELLGEWPFDVWRLEERSGHPSPPLYFGVIYYNPMWESYSGKTSVKYIGVDVLCPQLSQRSSWFNANWLWHPSLTPCGEAL